MGKRILIVDDAIIMRIIIKRILVAAGYEVVGEARDGKEAYFKYMELKPDLVTMDITMPEYNGLEGMALILKSDPNAKIIVCSAMGQKHMIVQAVKLGAKGFLVKPLEVPSVVKIVKELIGEAIDFSDLKNGLSREKFQELEKILNLRMEILQSAKEKEDMENILKNIKEDIVLDSEYVFCGMEDDTFYSYPNIGELPEDYLPTEREWYKNALKNDLYLSEIYINPDTENRVVTVSKRIAVEEKVLGVIAVDLIVK